MTPRRRLVADGGPYVAVLDDAPAPPLALAVKDMIALRGEPMHVGSRLRRGPAARDAVVVERLRRAGATVVGRVAMHELAFGVTGVNAHEGTPENPWDPGRIPGGSSSGAAVAVAEGSARIALGTDTGGSIRIPAALCGVVGFKPARGSWPADGVLALAPSLDHVAVAARSVADVALAHRAIAGAGEEGPERPLRLGVLTAQLAGSRAPVRRALEAALTTLEASGVTLADAAVDDDAAVALTTTIMFHEAARTHAALSAEERAGLGADVAERLERGAVIAPAEHRAALRAGERLQDDVAGLWERFDALVGPVVADVAAPRDGPHDATALVRFTRLANLLGLPAVSLPVLTDAGLPAGVQLLAPDDTTLLRVARAVEARLPPVPPPPIAEDRRAEA